MLSLYFEVHYYLLCLILSTDVCAAFWPPGTTRGSTDKRYEQGGGIRVGGQCEQGLGA